MKRKAKTKNTINYVPLLGVPLLFLAFGILLTQLSPTGNVVLSSGSQLDLIIGYNQTENINQQIPINTQVNFTANLSNKTGSPVSASDINCTYRDNSSGTWSNPANMTFDAVDGNYKYNKSFPTFGAFAYNITCFGNDSFSFEQISALESLVVDACNQSLSSSINFTSDLSCPGNGLIVGGSNVQIDCRGHSIIGNGTGVGINLTEVANTRISNCSILNFSTGIFVLNSALNILEKNIFTNNSMGVMVTGIISMNNNISGSRFNNNAIGVQSEANRTHIISSNFTNNYYYGINSSLNRGCMVYINTPTYFTSSNIILYSWIYFQNQSLTLNNSDFTYNGQYLRSNGEISSLGSEEFNFTANTSIKTNFTNQSTTITFYLSENVSNSSITVLNQNSSSFQLQNTQQVKTIDVVADNSTRSNLTWAIITIDYNATRLLADGITPSKLKIYYYNETSTNWQLEPNQGINTTENYTWVNVTHFSMFSLLSQDCAIPSSGDWTIPESMDAVCTDIPFVQINGSVNVAGNLTLRNSTFNSSYEVSLLNNSQLYLANSNLSMGLNLSNQSLMVANGSFIKGIGSISGNITIQGNFTITQKTISLFSNDANIARFFNIYVYNGSSQINGTFNITYSTQSNNQILRSGIIANSSAMINLTFNSTTYTNQYSINTSIGYVGKISLLDDTPIIKTTAVSSIPLAVSLGTANGTLFNDTAYLQFSSNKDISCQYSLDGGNYTNATKTGSYFKLFNGTYLRYNNTLISSYPILNATQLPFILSRDVFSEFLGSNDNDVAYTEEFRVGNNAKLSLIGQGGLSYPINKNATTYLYFENETVNNITYNYILRFNTSIRYNNFSLETASDDLTGSRIKIQGTSYNITSINLNSSGNSLANITISDGNTIIKLINNFQGKVQVNGSEITNAFAFMMGTHGNWTGINITYYPNNRIYLAEGESYTDPVFGKLKFVFTKLNIASTENISFSSSQGNATLNFTDINNTLISIPYYSNGTHSFRGYNSTRPVLIKGENYTVSTAGSQVGMLFFFVKNTTGEARMLRLNAMDVENHTLNISDDTYSLSFNTSYYNSSDNLSVISLGSLGNITFNISADQKNITYQDAPRITAKTRYGADVQLNSIGALFNENNASINNVTIQINITSGANWTYDITNVLTRVSKIYGDNTIKLANTMYGTMIEDDDQNNSYITITHPQTSTYADVYLAGADVDNASLIAGTLPSSSRYIASSNYTYNNLSLTCTDGLETSYFSLNVNISKVPSLATEEITTTIESATINITTDIITMISLRYGTTTALLNSVSYNESGTDHGIYLPGLASDTNYYYNLTICDIYARCMVSANTFITQHRESNPTGNSINYIDVSAITNTNPFANRRFAEMKAGETYSSEMNFGKVPVTKVEFTARKDLDAAVFTFFKLKNSSEAPSLSEPEKIYSYMSFNLTKASFEDLSDVKITFRVDKIWLDQNNLSKDSIALDHYAGQWEELDTQYEKQDPFYHYYKTKVTGFSIFAITATKGEHPTAAQPAIPAEENPSIPAPITQPSPPETPSEPIDYQGSQETDNAAEPSTQQPADIQSIADKLKELTQNALFIPIAIAILALVLVGGGVAIARRPKSMVQELARKQMTTQEVLTELKSKGVYGQSLEEMRQFISASIHEGKNANEIKAALLSVGWEEHIIDDVFQLFNVH